jgi:hypothetical protein
MAASKRPTFQQELALDSSASPSDHFPNLSIRSQTDSVSSAFERMRRRENSAAPQRSCTAADVAREGNRFRLH